ncbi:MAG: NAD-dependent deacylase [Thermodesulfobacteriota bacterium]
MDSIQIDAVRERLSEAKKIVVLTGAGISAESGVPTFRGADGLWKNFRAEELATPEAFSKDPKLIWEWYSWRRDIISKVKPNPAHLALAELEEKSGDFALVTQNVDGLHGLAGSKNIYELHGNIWRTRCLECSTVVETRSLPESGLPHCNREGCKGLLRPDIVWFGESLPMEVVTGAFQAVDEADFMFVIGTSSVVQPAASLSSRAKSNGAYVVEINPEKTPISDMVDASFQTKAGDTLPKLI